MAKAAPNHSPAFLHRRIGIAAGRAIARSTGGAFSDAETLTIRTSISLGGPCIFGLARVQ